MGILVYAGLILVSLTLQSTLFTAFPLMGVTPDLMLVLVVVMALVNGPRFGARFGFAAGLSLDLLVGDMVGLNALVKLLIGVVVGYGTMKFYKDNYLIPLASVVGATILDQALHLLGSMLFGLAIPWMVAVRQVIIPLSIYNSIVVVLVYVRLYYLNKRIAYWDELVKRSG